MGPTRATDVANDPTLNRRTLLTGLAVAGAGGLMPAAAGAQATPDAQGTPTASPVASPAASPMASPVAAQDRRFGFVHSHE